MTALNIRFDKATRSARAAMLVGTLLCSVTPTLAAGAPLKGFGGSSLDMLAPRQTPEVRKTILKLREATGEGASERVLCGTPDTAFRRHWLHTVDDICRGAAPLTPLSGGLDDLDLALRIIKALPADSERDA